MIQAVVVAETNQSVVHLWFEVDTEVALLTRTTEVEEEIVEEEDVVITKAMQSREASQVLQVPEVLIGVVKVASDTALVVI
jgi:hypothetical protein